MAEPARRHRSLHHRGRRVPARVESREAWGSTLHWEGTTLRLRTEDFRMRTLHGVADDWPIAYEEIEPYYGRAERALGVAGTPDDPWASGRSTAFPLPPFPLSFSDGFFAGACRKARYRPPPRAAGPQLRGLRRPLAVPRLRNLPRVSHRSQGEHGSHAYPAGRGHWPRGSRHRCHRAPAGSRRIEPGALRGVRGRRPAGAPPVRADLRGGRGRVETARLLLLSASPAFPRGLANRSGLVGRYFTSHPMIDVTGRVAERVYPYRIGFSTAMSSQFAAPRRPRAARGLPPRVPEFGRAASGEIARVSGAWGRRSARA